MDLAAHHVRQTELDKEYEIAVVRPKECDDEWLAHFADKVGRSADASGGNGSPLKAVSWLGYIIRKEELVGTVALKRPTAGYRRKIFKQASSTLDAANYSYELDWMILDEEHRKKGQMTRLVSELLNKVDFAPIFTCVEKSDNLVVDTLLKFGFSESGVEYSRGSDCENRLLLFVYPHPNE